MSEFDLEPNAIEFVETRQPESLVCLRKTIEAVVDTETPSNIRELAYAELDRHVIGETQLGSRTWVRLNCGVTACSAACQITDAWKGKAEVESLVAVGRVRSLDDCIQE